MRRLLTSALLLVLLVGCSFEFSIGGLDYEELETAIAEELTSSYGSDATVADVVCEDQGSSPATGTIIECTAGLEETDDRVRVDAEVTSDDGDVSFATVDTLFVLPDVATELAGDVGEQVQDQVTLDCGEGLLIAEDGDTFTCDGTDSTGQMASIAVTVDGDGLSWTIE